MDPGVGVRQKRRFSGLMQEKTSYWKARYLMVKSTVKRKKTRFPVAYRNKLADLGPSFSRG
jgi:hypothetical protein